MAFFIQKFGGTSVANPNRLQHVASLIKRSFDKGDQIVVVVSAMAGVTNQLVAHINNITKTQNTLSHDFVLASGEQVTTGLLSLALKEIGIPAEPFLGWQVPIITDSMWSQARILEIQPTLLQSCLQKGIVPIVAGFQGITQDKRITTIGRGGSDTTAVALAAALKADRCDIYTDVEGVFTADPRIVPKAKKLKVLTYEEMFELSSQGAKVLQVRSVEMAMRHNVPLRVLSSFKEVPGTDIIDKRKEMEKTIVTGIAHNSYEVKITLIGIEDSTYTLSHLFEALTNDHINVDMIVKNTTYDHKTDLTFTVSKDDVVKTQNCLLNFQNGFKEFLVDPYIVKISIVGVGMRSHPGVASLMFKTLADHKIKVHIMTTSEIKIGILISGQDVEKALQVLHTAYGLDGEDDNVY
ncbi:MAG: aspartate kinase [Proteobacteria bacterium]|nr:aspartate kinase [Pseudomonadota bacterium]